jgi:hypothetical protein
MPTPSGITFWASGDCAEYVQIGKLSPPPPMASQSSMIVPSGSCASAVK